MKVRSNGRVYRSETEWRAILADHQESGSSQTEYCRRHGIALQSFSKAMSRYATREELPESFVEVLRGAGGEARGALSCYRVELDLGSSIVLRIR